jgi:hypothetical protein
LREAIFADPAPVVTRFETSAAATTSNTFAGAAVQPVQRFETARLH